MTSFSELGAPPSGFLQSTVWRAALALVVVFVMLAMTGWTAVRSAKDTSDPLASSRKAWAGAAFNGHRLPDPFAAPEKLSAFFASLGRPERSRLAERYPLVVGNMNGAPLELRYRANRLAVEDAREAAERRMNDRRLTPTGRHDAGRLMHRLESLLRPGRQILSFDPARDGRAAEVFGDLAQARKVSVVVPGVDTNLVNFERTERRASSPVGMASALYSEERKVDPGARTAVIAWADYTAPVGVRMESATGRLAAEGALRLESLVDGVLPDNADVALFCHSYGSVLCGIAAKELPGRVGDIVVAGSPGMRAQSVTGLHTDARIWAARNPEDWIQDVPNMEVGGLGHGADPVDPAFGSRVLSAARAVGHAGYFVRGTESLANFARVGVGAVADVRCATQDPACSADLVPGLV